MEKNPSTLVKIRFIDCDPLGHLTNSRYIDYMLNAREDQVSEAYDLDYEKHSRETACSWVTLKNQISYIKEVRYGAKVSICSKIIAFNEKKITVEILMKDEAQNKIHAVLWTDVIYFSLKERKSAQHTPELMEMFQEVMVELEEKDFNTRTRTLLTQK